MINLKHHFTKNIKSNNIKNGIEKLYRYCIKENNPYIWAIVEIQGKKYYVANEGWYKDCLVGFRNLKEAHEYSLKQFTRMNLKHIKTVWKLFPEYLYGISIDIFEL